MADSSTSPRFGSSSAAAKLKGFFTVHVGQASFNGFGTVKRCAAKAPLNKCTSKNTMTCSSLTICSADSSFSSSSSSSGSTSTIDRSNSFDSSSLPSLPAFQVATLLSSDSDVKMAPRVVPQRVNFSAMDFGNADDFTGYMQLMHPEVAI